MSDSPRKVSRQELYEKIWITPIVKLGKELGYSYLEMVQLCEKLNIPRFETLASFRLWQSQRKAGWRRKNPQKHAAQLRRNKNHLRNRRQIQRGLIVWEIIRRLKILKAEGSGQLGHD